MHFYSPKFFILSPHSLYSMTHSVFSTERASVLITILEMYHVTVAFVMLDRIDGYFNLIEAFVLFNDGVGYKSVFKIRMSDLSPNNVNKPRLSS